MPEKDEDPRRSLNPARRRDLPGEEHGELEPAPGPEPEPPKSYQRAEPEARDQGGIPD